MTSSAAYLTVVGLLLFGLEFIICKKLLILFWLSFGFG